jgi:hypothetical protein
MSPRRGGSQVPAAPAWRAHGWDAACYGASMAITADRRRALEMLAGSESVMRAHGFTVGLLAGSCAPASPSPLRRT